MPLFLLFCLLALPAFAHAPGDYLMDAGFLDGLTHPVLGLDHLLAMVGVGVWSAQMGGRAVWTVPATFVLVMLIGGIIGMMGIGLLYVELCIALSVVALGAAIALAQRAPVWGGMLFVGFFAIFHGYAHGIEMPMVAEPFWYALGFCTGTAVLHLTGVAIGVFSERLQNGTVLLRYAGAVMAGMGLNIAIETIAQYWDYWFFM